MKQIYLTKKINEIVSMILILLGLKKESIGLSTTSTSKSLINFDSRNSFGLYSFKAALVLLFFVFGLGNNVFGQTTLLSPTGDGGFETASTFPLNGWTVVNGTKNMWYIGTAAGVQGGSNAAFTGSSATSFTGTGNSSVNHIYRDVVIPSGATTITLSFYIKMPTTDSTYDYLNVYTTTTGYTPGAGTLPSTGYTSVFSNTSTAFSTYTLKTVSLPNSLAGTTVRLVFTFKCDGASPYAAAALDNIGLTYVVPQVPTITSFTPSALCVQGGQTVTLTGTNLTGATAVKFNGVNATSFSVVSATSITAVVPANVTDGTITVTNPAGTATSGSSYTAAPTPTIGVSSGQTICSGQSVSLTATGGSTYSWSPATGLSATNTASVSASPTSTTTYTVTGTSAANCSATATVTVTVNPTPSAISISKNPAIACLGGTSTLIATGGTIASTGSGTVGTGTTLSSAATTQPTAFLNRYKHMWEQMVFTPAELTAAGIQAGNITSIKFNIDAQGSATSVTDFKVRMGSASSATLSAFQTTGLTQVFSIATYNVVVGLNTITFDTPYTWDGTSNVILDIRQTGIDSTNNATTYYTATTGNTVVSAMTSTVFASSDLYAASAPTATTSTQRLNTTFGYSKSVPATVSWSPATDLFTNAGATSAYVNENIKTVYSKSTVPQTYTVNATNGSCSSTASVTVTPNPLPTITANSATICTGGAGTTLTADGGATYSWSPALGLNGTTGTSVTANPTATTTYTITGTDANGCVNTTTATVSVNNSVAIGTQPVNQVVLQDTAASFSVVASGTGLSYQWYANDGGGWASIEGATAATYTIDSASVTLNGYIYRCVVTGTCNTVTSTNATLTVGSVSIAAQPTNQVVCSDTGATFSLTTSGEVTSYQWQMSTNGTAWNDVADATASSLVLSGLTSADTGKQYRCVLNYGAVTSNAATLTVYNAIAIGTQPTNQTVCSNAASVTFTSAATGSGLAYQWQVSTNGTSWNNVSGATAATYTINTPSVALNNNQYRVIASGIAPCSAVTSDVVTLTVNQVVAITAQPVAVNQCSTISTASFSATATGTGLMYQWQYSTNGTTWNDYAGATASALTVDSPATYNGNSFRCVVNGTAPCTSLTSNAVTLNVSQILGGIYTVGTGGNYATLAAAVTAYNNAVCFSDNVVFSLTDASYDIGTTALTISQNANVGAYTLTIKPATGVTASITGAVASGAIFNVKANNVTIDGSNSVAGTTRDLTISNTATTSPSVVKIMSTGTTPIANAVIKNAVIVNGVNTSSAISATDVAGTTGYFNGVTVQNNDIRKAYIGVFLNAATGNASNAVVSNNKLDNTGANAIRLGGVYIAGFNGTTISNNSIGNFDVTNGENDFGISLQTGCSNATVSNNTISGLGMTSVTSYAPYGVYVGSAISNSNIVVSNNTISNISSVYGGATYYPTGIWVAGATAGVTIDSNKISNIKNNYTTYAYGAYGIRLGSSSTTANVLVKNNMVWDVATYSGTTTLGYNALGIYASAGAGYRVYNNTVNLGTQLSSSGSVTTAAFAVGSSVSAAGALDVRNNIFVNTQTTSSSSCYAIYSASANTVFSSIDNNDYWAAGTNVGYLSSNITNLAGIVTGFGGNANSKNIKPNFVSATDMHMNLGTNSSLDNLGTSIAEVSSDIDNEVRSATPDMGADEFTTLTCANQTLTAGTATSTIAGFCNTTTGATVSAAGYTIGVGTTYQWEMSTNGASFTGVGTASAIYANLATGALSATTYYRLAAICDGGSTVYSNVVTIVKYTAAVTTASGTATICVGQSATLTADGSSTYAWSPAIGLNGTTGASVIATPSATTTYTVTGTDSNGCSTTATATVTVNAYPSTVSITQGAASLCANTVMSLTATGGTIVGSSTATLGAGLSTSTSAGVNPFYGGYGGVKTQFLIKASELTALGMSAGKINSLALNLTTAGSNLTNLGISVGSSSLTNLTSNIETGLTSVYTTASFVPVVGANTFNFSSPYTWDGTSNIIVSFCWSNANTSNTVSTVSVDAPGFTSSNARYVDSVVAADVCSYTGSATPSGWNGSSTTGTSRPKMVFGYSITVPTTMTWSPTTELYTNAAATTPYTGGAATVVYTKPSTSRTYTATASNGSCSTSASTNVNPTPAPDFTLSSNVTICKGGSTTLEALGSGYTYVWTPALGLNGTTSASVSANPTTTTTYTVEATDTTTGCKASKSVTVTVSEPGAINPVGTTTSQLAIPGDTTTFTVATVSGTTYTYQWQVNDGSGWANLANDNYYAGVTTATLALSNIQSTWDGYLYQCLVTGASPCATLTPIVATLTIASTGIATQPQNTTICGSATATSFTIVTNGDDPYGIQWQMSTDGGASYNDIAEGTDATTGMTFSGVDATTLNVSDITLANSGVKFICVLNYYLNSDAATLTVKKPVVITTQPVDSTICSTGGTATFTAAATGDNLGYQWQVSTNGTTWNNYTGTGATSASIAIVNPAVSANGTQYRVVVSGNAACGSVTSSVATLFINNPTITTAPIAASVLRGNTATFTVAASAATSYQWQRSATLNGTYVNVVNATPTGTTYSGADSATLAVVTSSTTATGGGNYYRCVVNNNGCTVTSTGALMTVNWYCTPAPTSVDGTGITNVTLGSINNTTGSEPGRYGDYTAQSTTTTQLSTVNFSITYETGYTYGTKIWIDFNDNGLFTDAGEQVYFGLSTSTNPTTLSGSFSVPLTAPLGSHRMRIGGSDNDLGVDPCYASSYAQFEDYSIVITPAPTCDGTPTAGTASSSASYVCSGSATNVLTTGATSGVLGVSYQWYSSMNGTDFTAVSGATSSSIATGALTQGTYYYSTITCSTSGLSANTNTVFVDVYNPLITGTTPAGRCGTGTATLGATANDNATINWYAASTGGASLGTGTSFTTPSISATTTYYVDAFRGGSLQNIGNQDTAAWSEANFYTTSSTDAGIVFTTLLSNVTIKGANAYVTGTGTLTYTLKNPSGTTIATYTQNVTNATSSTAVHVDLPSSFTTGAAAAGYSLILTKTGVTWYYFTGSYPYTSSALNVTSGWGWGATTTDVRGIHNIDFVSGCTSSRTAVTATVDALPTATISYAGSPFCSSATTGAVTRTGTTGGTYSAGAGLSIDAASGAINVAASTPGSYTVTYAMNGTTYCAAQTATTTVVINQALTSNFGYDASTYCSNAGTVTPNVTGTAGTFTASPAGLSINATTGVITLASSTAGTYTVTNTVSVVGCSNSVSTATVTINRAVAITTQPISASQLVGDTTSFTVAATGTGLSYQWEVNNGSGWAAITGETGTTLSLTAVTAEMNGYQYRVVVSGASTCSSVNSDVATLTVATAAITSHPANFTACNEGATSASFSVTTVGVVETYQWQVSTNGTSWSDVSNDAMYANANTASLSLSGLTLSNNGWKFRCVVNGLVYSNAGTLSVNTAVAIATQPTATTGCTAGSASFSVSATGSGLSYQWQVSTNGTTWNNVSGATSATLTLNSLTASMNGNQYQVIVNGASPCSAVTSSPASLTVNTAVAISAQPSSSTTCSGANATFSVTATGTAPTYQWQMSTNGTTYADMSGETGATLSVASVTTAMTGYKYRVVVSGAASCGSVTSSAATLTVTQPAAPIFAASTVNSCPDGAAALTVTNPMIVTQQLGTSTSTTSSIGVTPFGSYYEGAREQYIVRASELTALGYNAGNITSLAFNVTTAGSYAQSNFAIKLGSTTSNNVNNYRTPTGGFTTVYSVASLATPATGWKTFAFSTPYAWDGTSNILVDICHDNDTNSSCSGCYGTSSTVECTSTTFNSVYGSYADNAQSCDTVAANTVSSTTRPNMKFGIQSGTTTWSPITGLYTDASATNAYTGGNAITVYAKPTSSTTYTASNVNTLGCANTSNVAVNILAPATLASIAQPTITCSGQQTTFALTGLSANSTSTISYTVNGGAAQTVSNVVADANGNGSFTIALAGFTNGQTLAITAIQRTDITPNCSTAITANNTVIIAVRPLATYYADTDGDGYGNYNAPTITCQGQPTGYVSNSTDCNDADATMNATYSFYADTDADGYGVGTSVTLCAVNAATAPSGYSVNNTDCNDADATMNATYSFYADTDTDGYGAGSAVILCAVNASTAPSGYAVSGSDCNDSDATMHATYTFYADTDADGYGAGSAVTLCAVNASTAPTGYSVNNTDCNDSNVNIHVGIGYYVDADGDGYGSTTSEVLCSTTAPSGYATNNTDCSDTDATVHVPSNYYIDADADGYDNGIASLCASTAPMGYASSTNGSDCNDADATVHYAITYYVDADADGYGSTATADLCSSTAPTGYATNNTDCNDSNDAVNTAAAISSQPVNASICKAVGGTASFSVVATPGATYQWMTQIATSTTAAWTNISNNANYSGATSATLNVTRTTTSVPATGTKYKVVVTNACGTVTSDVATLSELATLSKATAISVVGTLSPALTVCEGSTVNLSFATGSIGNIQWMYSSDEGLTWQTFDSYTQTALSAINGVLTTTSPALTSGSAWFKVVASNGVCSSATSTNVIKLTVSSPAVAGEISGDDSICATSSSVLTLTGSTGTIVWQKSTNWTAATPTWAAVAGATATSLNTGALTASTAFRALLTNGACKATTDLYVVNVTPVAKATAISVVGTLSPALTVCEGSTVNLSLATGSIGNVDWMYSSDQGLTWTTFDTDTQTALSATNGVVTTTSPSLISGSAWFKVVASNGICSAMSAELKLTVSSPAVAGDISGDDSICATSSSVLTLTGSTGTIVWQKSTNWTAATPTWAAVTGATATSLNTGALTASTAFRALLTNGACKATTDLYVVNVTPVAKATAISVVGTLSPALTVCEGSSVNLSLATGSIGNVQWQMSTTSAIEGFENVGTVYTQTALSATNLAIPFTSSSLTQDTWFRVVATNGICSATSAVIKITVSTTPDAGSISGGNVTVCAPQAVSATVFDVTGNALTDALTNSTTLTLDGASAGATIVWQKSVNYTAATPTWAAAGSTASELVVANLAVSTWYRAQVTNGACVVYTDVVNITVSPSAKAGAITSAATVCTGGSISFTSAAYTGDSISWEVSTTSATTGFTTVSGANGLTFTMDNVTLVAPGQKFYVRNVVTSGACTLGRSAVKTITVNPLSVAGTITGAGTICSGGGTTLKLAGNVGTIQWQYSADGVDYVNVPTATVGSSSTFTTTSANGTSATYIVSNMTDAAYFRAVVTSGACSASITTPVQMVIGTEAVAGTLSAATSTVCAASGTTLTLTGNVGSITWQKSTNWTAVTPTWSAATGTASTLATGALTATTAFKAIVTIGSCSTVETTPVIITVSPAAKGGTVAIATTNPGAQICIGSNKTLTVSGNVGTIQWQMSTTSATDGFVDVAGATTTPYTFTNITQNSWFRVVATSGVCTTPGTSSAVGITVTTIPAVAGTISGVNSVCTATGSTLTLSGSTGSIVWQKAVSPFTAWSAVTGATTGTLATGNLTATTAYRAIVTSGSCTATTEAYVVTVSPLAKISTISGNSSVKTLAAAVCSTNTVPLTLAVGYVGAIQWQYYNAGSSATAISNTSSVTWTDINAATSAIYNAGLGQQGNIWYRVKLTSGACSVLYTAPVNVWYKLCTAKVEQAPVAFKVSVYPNPSSDVFNVTMTTSSESSVQMMVYDMTGKLIDQREVAPSEVSELQIGERYPSGVYNVIVTQGEETKTLRVIKR